STNAECVRASALQCPSANQMVLKPSASTSRTASASSAAGNQSSWCVHTPTGSSAIASRRLGLMAAADSVLPIDMQALLARDRCRRRGPLAAAAMTPPELDYDMLSLS